MSPFYELKGNYFEGEFHQIPSTGLSAAEAYFERTSPSNTDLHLWSLPLDYRHIDDVVESSVRGFKFWRQQPLNERINYLKSYQEQLLAKKDDIAKAIALDTGKPLWEAYTEASALVAKVDVTISDSLPRVETKEYPNIQSNTKGEVYYKPIGPCFVIGPFNFPCHLANGQILSALIAGNSVIFKPSEKTAYSAQLMMECFHEAGFPNGVMSLIQGDGETARRILQEKPIKGVFFTGSKEVGLKILQHTHQDLSKLVALELGGKNPAIVHNDIDIDFAIQELLRGSFLTTGQRCTSTSLAFVHGSFVEQFVEKFHQYAKKLIIDHPIEYEAEPFMGPLIDKKAADEYLLYMGMAKREGLQEIMRGKLLEREYPGHYVSPSIHLAKEFNRDSHFLMSEIFGPNCTIVPYQDEEEAIDMANATEYGLAASVFTHNQNFFQKCVQDIDTGLVNLNRSTVGASSKLPFGGVKNSGNYRPAAVATIDSCVYSLSSLQLEEAKPTDYKNIKGLKLD